MFCSRCGTEVQQAAKFCPSCGLDQTSATIGGGAAAIESAPTERSEFDIVRDALKDEYELIRELGRGGMAIVFMARDKALDREVAIKVLPFSLSFDKDFVERFQREAKTSARLEHPNIIPIYRVGRNDKVIYFVMKFLRGTSLSELIQKRGLLPTAQIRQMLVETARALHYAHQHGIVHRDIKPDNIMFDELGHAIVTDFGIAKAASGTKLTGTGMSIGTPHYMSPEQARAQGLDGRSDIYSLGVVGYQCLTGKVPFDGEDSFSIGYKHIMEELPIPALKGAEQRELFEVIRRMLAKAPEERFQNAELVAQVLDGKATLPSAPMTSAPTVAMTAATTRLSAVPPVASSTTPTTPIPRGDSHPAFRPREKKGSGGLVAFMILLLLGGGGAGGYWYYFVGPGKGVLSGRPVSTATTDSVTAPVDSAPATTAQPDTAPRPVPAAPGPEVARPTTGILVIRNAPVGARFRLNAEEPTASDSFTVEPGMHKVEIAAAGYESYTESARVGPGEKIVLQASMTRQPAPPPAGGGQRAAAPGGATPQRERPRAAIRAAAAAAAAADGSPHCELPTTPGYNAGNLCFDTRPVLETPFVPVPEGVEGTPSPSIIWVLVTAQGVGQRVVGVRPSSNPLFHVAAMNYARSVQYRPAEKGGRPVTAWAQFQFPPQR